MGRSKTIAGMYETALNAGRIDHMNSIWQMLRMFPASFFEPAPQYKLQGNEWKADQSCAPFESNEFGTCVGKLRQSHQSSEACPWGLYNTTMATSEKASGSLKRTRI